MRTTLTLDDDIVAKLKSEVRKSRRSLKQVVNDALRTALNSRKPPAPVAPFEVHARALGIRPGLDYDNVSELLEQIEGPAAR